MTVNTTYAPVTATGDGSTTEFAFPYLVYQSSHLTITIDGASTSAWTAATYGSASGVTVTFDTAPASGEAIIIQRIVPYTQDTDLENFDGNPSEVTEKQFDLLAMAVQQIAEASDRTILSPIGISLTTNEIIGTIDTTSRLLTITTAGPATSTVASISSTIDTVFTGEAVNDLLLYNGSNWVNETTLGGDYTFLGNNTFSGDANFTGDVRFLFDGELTISSGAVTVTGSSHTIDTESDAASDDLDTITGGSDGQLLQLRAAHTDRTVVIKDGAGNIETPDGEDISLDNTEKKVSFIYDGALSKWLVTASILTQQGKIYYGSAYNSISTYTTLSTILPADGTIPQNTEGDEFLTQAYTPQSSTSNLRITVNCHIGAANTVGSVGIALFKDSDTDALAASGSGVDSVTRTGSVSFVYEMTSGTTSEITFKLRGGSDVSTNAYLNGDGSASSYGSANSSSILIEEIEA